MPFQDHADGSLFLWKGYRYQPAWANAISLKASDEGSFSNEVPRPNALSKVEGSG